MMCRFSSAILFFVMAVTMTMTMTTMNGVSAFVVPISSITSSATTTTTTTTYTTNYVTALSMMDLSVASSLSETVGNVVMMSTPSTSLLLAETEAWVKPVSTCLGPFLNFMSFAMLCRVVSSWYPETNLNTFPWAIVAWPSEPLLRLAKGKIPPAFGVDITPVFWLAIFTFINEILLGQQGLLVMKMKYGI